MPGYYGMYHGTAEKLRCRNDRRGSPGSQNAKVKSYGLEAVESYGKQKQISEPRLKEIIGELLAQGYLWATPDKYALIHLEEKGEDFLGG